ncbi:hypothetical protein [Chloroflexus sp.]|uniref:hypothetical protein n=1 Tax=Chloroflexus sp. TaxID=1904827 RepID=UPI002ACDC206|nr:hypothetical protein [Chloroflexus sp.]
MLNFTGWVPVGLAASLGDTSLIISKVLVAAGVSVLMAVGVVVDYQFSLWNKHWYFSLPALAILAGVALDRIAVHHIAGNLVAAALVEFFVGGEHDGVVTAGVSLPVVVADVVVLMRA